MYGCYLPGEQDEVESHYLPKEAKGFMFAPKDIAPWQFEGKDDLHGIGYSGMQEQSVLGSVKATRALYGMSGEVRCVVGCSVVLITCTMQPTPYSLPTHSRNSKCPGVDNYKLCVCLP